MRPVRREYAPSKHNYTLQRLWLTRGVRIGVTRVLPMLILIGGLIGAVLYPPHLAWIKAQAGAARTAVVELPELMINDVEITGLTDAQLRDAVHVLALSWPVSSVEVDLRAARDRVEALAPVASAELTVGSDRVLRVDVTPRQAVAVWRSEDGLFLIDALGVKIGRLDQRLARADLPFLLDAGADDHVVEAVALAEAAGPLTERIVALVRVGERRWDIMLDRGQRIRLPEERPVDALLHVLALQLSEDVLERDVVDMDMRDRDRPTARISENAVREMRRLRQLMRGEDA